MNAWHTRAYIIMKYHRADGFEACSTLGCRPSTSSSVKHFILGRQHGNKLNIQETRFMGWNHVPACWVDHLDFKVIQLLRESSHALNILEV